MATRPPGSQREPQLDGAALSGDTSRDGKNSSLGPHEEDLDDQGQAALDRMVKENAAAVAKAWGIENMPRSGKPLLQRLLENGGRMSKNVEERPAPLPPPKVQPFESVKAEPWETEMHRFVRWLEPIYEYAEGESLNAEDAMLQLEMRATAFKAYSKLSTLAKVQLYARHPRMATFCTVSGTRSP